MLQLIDIEKSYTTGSFTQVALNHVSLAFRDNEFVAILGPSGSGKTTMLNIIGGLDHYDSGNLIIDGISTEQYKDHDWDTYRNNRIGFVFQSYNLIPHQTVLSNVELALTLSGVSKSERRERAIKALEEVGLGDHIDKKPSQLSGGQMQRVAIARALINDPEILLADEPTGALDSKTSVQIMNLLTNIAKDRLVIMVTHNPELAEEYATRIVNLSDGNITSDSNLFDPSQEPQKEAKPARKTSMSFLTALSLSFNNLMTKKGRTLMTAFAGSIGIIGIAAILALANGVNNYIKTVEEETLSEYPLTIQSTGIDMTSMLVTASTGMISDENGESEGDIREINMLTNMFDNIGSNDLASLKEYLESDECDIENYTNSIEYSYNVTPQIFASNTENGVHQVNPDKSFSALGFDSTATSNSLMSMSMSTDMFYEMPKDMHLVKEQYDVVAGKWPENYNECILVLTSRGGISDFMSYVLGLRDPDELKDMVKQFANNEDVDVPEKMNTYSYEDILSITFKLVNAADYYQYDSEYKVWKDKSDNANYMTDLINEGEDIKIVGIVQAKPDAQATALTAGTICYPRSLTTHIIEEAAQSEIVQQQLEEPTINVFTGKSFAEEAEEDSSGDDEFNMDSLFTIDGEALQAAFTIDQSKLAVDMSDALNLSSGLENMPAAPSPDMDALMNQLDIEVTPEQSGALVSAVMAGYQSYLADHPLIDPNDPNAGNINYEEAFQESFSAYLQTSEAQGILMREAEKLAGDLGLESQISVALQGYMQSTMTAYMGAMATELQAQVTTALQDSMDKLANNMASAMSIDADKFAEAFQMNMDEEDLAELMMSLMTKEETSYDNNLAKLGYADMNNPSEISIYPIDFESKEHVLAILDGYNDAKEAAGEESKVITYTDIVGTLMSSVTDIVNMISYVLIAFVAISLVVSSIMIGVITYISVLERKKEIGILRSIGASKRDISNVFNAETIIVGLIAGTIGIGVTALCCIPANAIVYSAFDVPNIAILPWQAALVLVGISVFLTFLAGLIPSSAASRKDPVEALRSE